MNRQRRILKLSSLGLVVLLAGVVAAATPKAFAQSTGATQMSSSNPHLQAEIASKLSRNKVLRGQNISVTVSGSQATLSGTVQTRKQWQEAETVTANVRGVRTILNNLTIAGQNLNSPMQAPPAPDLQQPPAPPTPQSPPSAMSDTGNPPPPPPDQASQSNQGYGQPSQQPRPEYQGREYQGNGYPSQSYGTGYGAQNYSPNNSQNGYAPPPQQSSGPVAVPAGTLLQIRLIEPLDSAHLKPGQIFDATVASDVWEGNVLAIPRGAMLRGVVVHATDPKGKLGGKSHLALQLTSLNMGGQSYRLDTNLWSGVGPNKAGYTASNTVTGGLLGAIIGGIIGRGPGAAVGAGLGAMTGLGVSSATKGPRIYIPSEAVLNFHLANTLAVQPVSWQEARRMAANMPQVQIHHMYRRYPPRPYPYGYMYRPYYYAPYPYYGPSYYYFGVGW